MRIECYDGSSWPTVIETGICGYTAKLALRAGTYTVVSIAGVDRDALQVTDADETGMPIGAQRTIPLDEIVSLAIL